MGFVFYGSRKSQIDPEIKKLVLFFNRKGYHTMGSCAGHGKYGAGMGKNRDGFIFFRDWKMFSMKQKHAIVKAATEYGCKNARFRSGDLLFNSMGRTTTKEEHDARAARAMKAIEEKYGSR